MLLHFSRITGFIRRQELNLFLAMVVLNLTPILSVKYFPTVDGPAHLYNANLIVDLLSGTSSWQGFIEFNQSFTPNWTGHLLLALLIKLFSVSIAEKMILGIYLVGVPISIKLLLKQLRAPSSILVYLVFPFMYGYLFHFGFFNYNLAIVFFFLGLIAWIHALNSKAYYNWLLAGFMAVIIALSHPFVFGLFCIAACSLTLSRIIVEKSQTLSLIKPLASLIPGIVITCFFLISSESVNQEAKIIPWKDLLISFKYIMPIKGLNPEMYHWPSKILLYLFLGLTALSMVRLMLPSDMSRSTFFIWLIITVITAVLVFIMPDYLGDAGLISSRLLWFFFIFLIITFSQIEFPDLIRQTVAVIAVTLAVWTINHNVNQIQEASKLAEEIEMLSSEIERNSTILPITHFCSKQFSRVAHYAALNKDQLVLNNYEAELSYFPLVWNYSRLPKFRIGRLGPSDCVGWVEGKVIGTQPIDYVLLANEPRCNPDLSCEKELQSALELNYTLVRTSVDGYAKLFRSN